MVPIINSDTPEDVKKTVWCPVKGEKSELYKQTKLCKRKQSNARARSQNQKEQKNERKNIKKS